MAFSIGPAGYVECIKRTAEKIAAEKTYITDLDAATGDGDHWINLNMGFEALVAIAGELEALPLAELFKKIGMTLMSVVGGSSGILYGSAYLAMGRVCKEETAVTRENLGKLLEAMMQAMMKRGNSEPGQKTMIDTLYGATQAYEKGLEAGLSDKALLEALAQGARDGAESTRQMPAVRGRACYQANKGVGHLDPGAVTMCFQIELLSQVILETLC